MKITSSSLIPRKCLVCSTKLVVNSSLKTFGSRLQSQTNTAAIQKWRQSFEEYAKINNLSSTDWYQLKSDMLDESTRKILKKEFKGSLFRALTSIYPEIQWYPWKFQQERAPVGYWQQQTNLEKLFFDDLGKQIGIQTLDDWYEKLSVGIIENNGARSLMKRNKSSPLAMLMAAYPEHNWIPWKFKYVPMGYWRSIENQKKYFDWLGNELGVKEPSDWYQKLNQQVLTSTGGLQLLHIYNNSPSAVLKALYPDYNWIPWKFGNTPMRFWQDPSHHRLFFDELGKELGIEKLDDWYDKLTAHLIQEHGGVGLLFQYKNSPSSALMAVYPDHNWVPWKFKQVGQGYWHDLANHKKFFDALGKQIGIQQLDDWYEKLSVEAIVEFGGGGLLAKYKGQPASALMAIYPEHNWLPWKFNKIQAQAWTSKHNVTRFLAELSEKLSIQTLDDWYRVDWIQLNQLGANTLLLKYKGLYNILKEQYPNHPWDPKKFKQVGKKTQRWLAVTLKKMFPNEEILEDYLHPDVKMPTSNRPMQLDIFLPSKNLAFEYQGIQHYQEVSIFNLTATYQQRDDQKRSLCAANNIKLIEVPYWWNRTQESLQEIINKATGKSA